MAVKKNYLVEKLNLLNEFRPDDMSLQELRFFSIYLSKINARDPDSRVVRFSREEFMKVVGAEALNIDYLHMITDSLLRKIIRIPEAGGITKFQLFKRCRIEKDDNNEWFFDLNAHDESLPLMFEFKEKYFTYELGNIVFLKSVNQFRMYEILKQYEYIGERTIPLEELRELLGVKKEEYTRFGNFRAEVLDVCQQALSMSTDITFKYKTIRGKGNGGKINAIKFTIEKNENFTCTNSSPEPAEAVPNPEPTGNFVSDRLEFLRDACNDEFDMLEISVLYNVVNQIVPARPKETVEDHLRNMYDYLKHRYEEFLISAAKSNIKHRFKYFKKILDAAAKESNPNGY